jgi:biopolymer transport protein ExbD
MKLDRKHTGKARIEMIPLIDVIFLLLVTFILFSMSMSVHRGIPVVLPSASTSQIEKKAAIEISIKKDGSIYMDGEKGDLADLSEYVGKRRLASPEFVVFISADKKASYEAVVAVMDAVRKAGIKRLSLETEWD